MVRAAPVSSQRSVQLLLLCVAMALGGYIRTALSPLQEAMRMALSFSDNQMALLQGPAIAIPVLLVATPLGVLIDRRSRVRLLQALVLLGTVGTLLTARATSFDGLVVARALSGTMGTSILPVVFSLVADLYPAARRGQANSLVVVGQVIGNAAAFWLGGRLLLLAGAAPNHWRWAMLWLAVPLVPSILLLLGLREPKREEVAVANPSLPQVWRELKTYRSMILLLIVGIVSLETAVGAVLIWGAPLLSRSFSLPPDRVGTVMACAVLVSGTVGPLAGGGLADLGERHGGPRTTASVLVALALLSVPVAGFGFLQGVLAASILMVLTLTFMLAASIMGMTLFTVVIPNELRGVCLSSLVAVILLFALAVAPVAVSLLSEAMGGLSRIAGASSIVCMSAGVIAAAAFVLGGRHLNARHRSRS